MRPPHERQTQRCCSSWRLGPEAPNARTNFPAPEREKGESEMIVVMCIVLSDLAIAGYFIYRYRVQLGLVP